MEHREEWVAELAGEVDLPDALRPFKRLPLILSRREVAELLGDAQLPGPVRLGLRTLYAGCLRGHEWGNWEQLGNLLKVGQRVVCLDEETARALAGAQLPTADELLGWLRQLLGARYERAERRLTLASLRHAGATHCLENGMDLITLNHQLGHFHFLNTENYVRCGVGLRRAAYAQAHPLMVEQAVRTTGPEDIEVPAQQDDFDEPDPGHTYARLTQAEIGMLMDAAELDLHRLLIRVFYATGLRREELVMLGFEDVDAEEGRVFVRYGKYGKNRYCLVDPQTVRELLALRGERGSVSPIFNLSWEEVGEVIATLATRTGLAQKYNAMGLKVTAHCLRNTFATHCYVGGMPPASLKQLLGHVSIQTLLEYVDCTPEHRQQVYEASR